MALFGGLFSKEKKESLDKGLSKSNASFLDHLTKALVGKSTIDADVLDGVEEALISSDVGINTTVKIIARIEQRVTRDKYVGSKELDAMLREEIGRLLTENKTEDQSDFETPSGIKPYVILVVGVNGVGKTTTIGKLAAQFKRKGKHVVLGAADTFRAAAVAQLTLWGERIGVPVVAKGMNTDPSAVAFETVEEAIRIGADVVLIDTAGRLHTKANLMAELSKIRRVVQKVIPDAPHEVLLVLDGSTGQNALIQAREFTKATEVTALAITKLDGTAKGGVVIGISDEFKIPVKYIGVGERVEDLQVFNTLEFVNSLLRT